MKRLDAPPADPGPDAPPRREVDPASERGLVRYVFALAVLGLALAIVEFFFFLDPDTGLAGMVLVAAVVAAGIWGRGPGLVVLFAGGIVFATMYQIPRAQAVDAVFWARVAVRFVTGVLAVWVVASLRQSRRRAERLRLELQRDERLRAAIMSVITHDLRSPLTAIRLHAQVARRSLEAGADPTRVPASLDAIVAATGQLDALVTDLGDVVRIQSRSLRVRPRPVDPAALARDVVAVQQPIADEKGVHLTLDTAPGVPAVRADRLDRAITNLVGNALKFTPPGGSVIVRVARSGRSVRISVEDTGPGIAPEHLPFIFDRGVRAPKQAGGGSGLGLYITRGIVEANGGKVTVASHLSKGSTFTITLPATAEQPRPEPDGQPQHPAPPP